MVNDKQVVTYVDRQCGSRNETSKEDTSNEGSRDSSSDEGRGTAGVLDISDDLGGEHLIKSLIVRLNH